MQHEVLMILLDGQFFKAPIGGSPKRILDVGAGTGIWAVDVADL